MGKQQMKVKFKVVLIQEISIQSLVTDLHVNKTFVFIENFWDDNKGY